MREGAKTESQSLSASQRERSLSAPHCVQREIIGERVLQSLHSSLSLLGHLAHLGADVSEQEECSCAGCTNHFSYPEGCAPTVVLSNGAEG